LISRPNIIRVDFARTDPDVALMLRVRDGDHDAFAELLVRYEDRVSGVLNHLLRNRRYTEDLSQDVFLRVFRARSTYSPDSKFSTWLFTIVNNVVRNARRQWSRRREVIGKGTPNRCCDTQGNLIGCPASDEPRQSLETKELGDKVRFAVGKLNERQRTATTLCRLEGLTHAEAAQAMDTTSAAVKALISRATGTLRKNLRSYVESDPGRQ
jgi:RNA polymerase sigma-70 factor, ECF subfamily